MNALACVTRGRDVDQLDDNRAVRQEREVTKVDAMNEVGLAAKPNEEVVRLDVAMDEGFVVDVLNPLQQLVSNHKDCFQVKLPAGFRSDPARRCQHARKGHMETTISSALHPQFAQGDDDSAMLLPEINAHENDACQRSELTLSPIAEVEKVLKRRSQQVHDHNIVVSLNCERAHCRDPDPTPQYLVQLRLIEQLWVLALD